MRALARVLASLTLQDRNNPCLWIAVKLLARLRYLSAIEVELLEADRQTVSVNFVEHVQPLVIEIWYWHGFAIDPQ
jgi:hypothetical protein